MDLEELLEKMTSLLHRKFQDPTTYSWVVSAITKMVAQLGRMSDIVHSQLILHLSSVHTDIQQVQCPLLPPLPSPFFAGVAVSRGCALFRGAAS